MIIKNKEFEVLASCINDYSYLYNKESSYPRTVQFKEQVHIITMMESAYRNKKEISLNSFSEEQRIYIYLNLKYVEHKYITSEYKDSFYSLLDKLSSSIHINIPTMKEFARTWNVICKDLNAPSDKVY